MKIRYTLQELPQVAETILAHAKNTVLLFKGPMGAGKTTLIKALCEALQVEDPISSPTFSIVNEYHTVEGQNIYHFDFYRIQEETEAYDIGFEDYLSSGHWCFIEWPENIENLLPLDAVLLELTILEDGKRALELNNN